MIFTNRGRTGPDPTLRVRTALFVIGAGVVLAGMRVGKPWAVNVGVVVLLIAVLLRLVSRRRTQQREDEQD